MIVELDWPEVLMAATIGVARHIESRRKGIINAHGFNGTGQWDIDIEGAAGEMAFAKALNVHWTGAINNFKDGDIGHKVQVRTTKNHNNKLIIRDNDKDDNYFVLVTGSIPLFKIQGFILGSKAKQIQWYIGPNGRPKAYFVPQDALIKFGG